MENNNIKFNEIYNSIFKLNISNRVNNELMYIMDIYKDYIDLYQSIDNKNIFNEVSRMNEILYLHSMEIQSKEQNDKLIKNLSKNYKTNSINYISNKHLKYNNLIVHNIKRLHTILMDGIADKDSRHKNFRLNAEIFVGTYENGEKNVQYYPPHISEIDQSMEEILTYLNDPSLNCKNPSTFKDNECNEAYSIFVMPIIVSALMTILQPFYDGNSRTSRLISSTAILNSTNNILGTNFTYPILYFSKGYYPYRKQYRELIQNIALNPNDENWNKWILFSLHAIEDYINYATNLIADNNLVK